MKSILLLFVCLIVCLTACQNKQVDTTATDSLKKDSVAVAQVSSSNAFNGTFEYDGGAWENGYLFYRLEMKQTGDSIKGTLFMGNYSSRSAVGGYIDPQATLMIDLHGEVQGPKEMLLSLDAIRDSIATDSSSKYPNVYDVFQEDAQGDLLQNFSIENGQLQVIRANDTLPWEKK